MITALIGFMGSGKSSVAQILAQRGCGFCFDTDAIIENEQGRSIREIFEEDGQEAFREMEADTLEGIFEDYADFPSEQMTIATGGGCVTSQRCRQLLKKSCRCIYLRGSIDSLTENIILTGTAHRPVLDAANGISREELRTKVSSLMAVRGPLYESLADGSVDIDGLTMPQIADKVSQLL